MTCGVRDNYGLKIGDKLVYQDLAGGQPFTLTIIGISDQKNFLISLGLAATTYNLVQTLPGNLTQFNINIDRNQLDAAKALIQTNVGKEPTELKKHPAGFSILFTANLYYIASQVKIWADKGLKSIRIWLLLVYI